MALVATLKSNITTRLKIEGTEAVDLGRFAEKVVITELVSLLDPGKPAWKPKRGKPNVVMFVGLQGAGKTTTVAKYAAHWANKGWKPALVCADTFRAGAFDQLKQNALRIRVPFYGSPTEADPVAIAREGVQHFRAEQYDMIIVDTSGRHKQESALFSEMEDVAAAVQPDEVVFVMDATIGQAAQSQAAAFKASVPVGSVIITKLDGSAKGGGALSAVAATGSPITFIGTGEHMSNLESFRPEAFLSKMLGRGDMQGLLEKLEDAVDKENQDAMMGRISKGKFSMRDFREQLSMIMKMGPLSSMAAMLPGGIGQMMQNMPGGTEAGEQRFKQFMCIMDSMTPAELDGKVALDKEPSRLMRIARGAGVPPQDVGMLLQMHKMFESMISKMGKSGLLKGGDAALQQRMSRDPKSVMSALSKSMDPAMLSRMGGAGGLMNMMKSITGGGGLGAGGLGGLGDIGAAMSSMFGGGGGGAGPGAAAGPGGMPDMAQAMAALANGGGLPGMPGGRAAKRKVMRVKRR